MAIHSDGTRPPARLQSLPSSCHQLRESAEPPSSSQNKCSVSFECNICLEVANDPVVTLCGHLFCWPCLYKWLQRSSGKDCPVCKATVEEKVIPLYGSGGAESLDSSRTIVHSDIPRRPLGQRPETLSSVRRHGRFRAITLSLGFGFLPSLLTLQFNNFLNSSSSVDDGDNGNNFGARGRFSYLCAPSQSVPATADQQEEAALVSRLVFLAVFAILCLFFL